MHVSQRFMIVLTLFNGALTAVSLSQLPVANAASDSVSVLRGRGLEIVDEVGRVRASIKVQPADPSTRMPDGSPTSDSVVLRLVNPDGRPGVKLGSSDREAGLALIGSQGNYLQVHFDGVKLTKGHQQRAAWPSP